MSCSDPNTAPKGHLGPPSGSPKDERMEYTMTNPTGRFTDTPDRPRSGTGIPATPAPQPSTAPPPASLSDADHASLKDKASDSAQAGKEAAGQVAQTAADKARTVVDETQRQARDLITEARSQASNEAARHHRNAATNLHSLGDELNAMSQQSEQRGVASELAAQGGQRAHDLASWLDDREPGDLLNEVRAFARRRPGAFLIGALAAGVVAGRLTRGAVAVHRDSGDSPSEGLHADTSAPVVPQPTVSAPSVPAPHEPAFGGGPS
jgi:hypothetical protein